ncbi:MAG: DUF1178 family protein [Ferrovum sp.]|nr:DUF1178 family protein [Ferrovum sp.]
MVRYTLKCSLGHGFEGWFSSPESFDAQKRDEWIACPYCHSTQVVGSIPEPTDISQEASISMEGQSIIANFPSAIQTLGEVGEALALALANPPSDNASPAVLIASAQSLNLLQIKLIQSVLGGLVSQNKTEDGTPALPLVVVVHAAPLAEEEGDRNGLIHPEEGPSGYFH